MNYREMLSEVSVENLSHAGYNASIMKAPRLEDNGMANGLPPGEMMGAIPINCLPAAPESWLREAGSYVVEVDCEHGLWFDWRNNNQHNTAVVPSVKGMNPITGMEIKGLGLEQYRDRCPKHDTPLFHDNLCEECGFRWPGQNYVSHPDVLWWDGFRQPDGTVRQFFFTEEDKRDVASAIIGKENTMPAFGFAFYKNKLNREPANTITTNYPHAVNDLLFVDSYQKCKGGSEHVYYTSVSSSSCSSSSSESSSSRSLSSISSDPQFYSPLHTPLDWSVGNKKRGRSAVVARRGKVPESITRKFKGEAQERASKDVSVGAGAIIRQNLTTDTSSISDWNDEPEGVIRLYFAFSEQLQEIVEKGGINNVQKEESQQGYMEGVTVG
jgi:hypothetical protein